MGKLLRVLVIIVLAFSIGALVLGILLFGKRELLKARTQKLENSIISLGTSIEAEQPEQKAADAFPAKDTSPCTSEVIENPERSDFWKSYRLDFEQQDITKLTLQDHKNELTSYYKKDPVTGKVLKDPSGFPVIAGEGTMTFILEELITKTQQQLTRMNETRQHLMVIREELVSTIEELNKRKSELRVRLKEIEDLKAEIERLKGEIAALKQKISELEAQIVTLQEEKADLERKNSMLVEEKAELQRKYDKLKKDFDGAMRMGTPGGGSGEMPVGPSLISTAPNITPGIKGKVVDVNPQWNFAVIELTDEFIAEIFGDKPPTDTFVPPVELMLKRAGAPDKFVTKLRLIQIKSKDKLGVADILANWQQVPILKGDIVFL